MGKTTVLLVEDHEVVLEGLRALLQTQPDIEVVGETSDGCSAVTMARNMSPNVVVMDVSLPGQNGFRATLQIRRASKETQVLVLSSYDDLECVEQMIDAGASGFLSKRSVANQLVDAIRAVRSGRSFYSPEISKRRQDFKDAALRAGRPVDEAVELTARERQTLELIAHGRRNKEVAAEMGISIKTVEKHRQCVMNKLNIHDAAGLTRYALTQGLISAAKSQACSGPVGI